MHPAIGLVDFSKSWFESVPGQCHLSAVYSRSSIELVFFTLNDLIPKARTWAAPPPMEPITNPISAIQYEEIQDAKPHTPTPARIITQMKHLEK
ncbi:hypothetical protein [Achromobacter sp. AONIH1]|uniref:hypothetical protein n=1 Tax=Achromobacter sp. AONIH1 TaxID=1758194 RepID=UPI001319E3FD|nr:hypothetical protein [Achromobacter sp. AONIH1]